MSREFNQEIIKLLKRIHSQSRHFQVRNRAHCLLLRNKGFTIAQLAVILEKSEKTIFNWWKSWNNRGLLPTFRIFQKITQIHTRQVLLNYVTLQKVIE